MPVLGDCIWPASHPANKSLLLLFFKSLIMKPVSIATLLSLAASALASPVHNAAETTDLVRRDGSGSVTGAGLNWYDPQIVDGNAGRSNTSTYVCYSGKAINFPPRSAWMNFKAMFALQKQVNLQYFDTANQIQYIYNAILNISQIAKVDARVILGVIIEEVRLLNWSWWSGQSTGSLLTICLVIRQCQGQLHHILWRRPELWSHAVLQPNSQEV